MKIADGWLLLKKILVGIAITVVPLAIIAGGLWSIQQARTNRAQADHDRQDSAGRVRIGARIAGSCDRVNHVATT